MVKSFQELFQQTANRLQVSRQLNASLICTYAREYLKEHFSENDQIKVTSFKNGQLNLSAPHSLLAQKLTSHKLPLTDLINEKTQKPTITKILIKIHHIPEAEQVNKTTQ